MGHLFEVELILLDGTNVATTMRGGTKLRKRVGLIIAIALLVSLALSSAALAANWDELRGGQIVLRIGSGVNNLVSGFEGAMDEYMVTRMLYDAPFQWIGVGEYRPQLGKTWEMLDENQRIRITLRDDLNWYDGTPITAEDLYFSWHWWKETNELHNMGPAWGEDIEKIEMVDKYTVDFYLTKSNPAFFDNVARQAILPKHLFEDIKPEDIKGHPWLASPPIAAASGPFVIEEIVPNERIVLRRNENWHGRPAAGPDWPQAHDEWPDKALLDRIVFLHVPDADTARMMFEKGEIDVFTPAAKDVDRFLEEAKQGKWEHKVVANRGYTAPMLNHRHPALADQRVRQALVQAIDFDLLIDVVFEGKAIRAVLPVAPQMWVYDNELVQEKMIVYDYDPANARQLLKEAGYGDGLTLTMKMSSASDPLLAETLQYMWKEVGIDVKLEIAEWGSLLGQVGDGDYEIASFGWGTGGFPGVDAWCDKTEEDVKSGWQVGYVNPSLHELQDLINHTTTREEQAKYFAEGYEIWTRDVPVLMLVHTNSYWFWNPRIGGFSPTETDYTVDGPAWYIKK